MKRAFSTTDVARLLDVAPASVVNWIDQGRLKAGQTPGGHRRIAANDLVEFARRQNLPIPPELEPAAPKILVVDDEPAVTKLIAEEIKAEHPDYAVYEAHDGFAAGEIVGAIRPDVVILDLRMPGMDGYEVCRRIKASEESRHAVVIVITALSPSAQRRALECGAQSCFTKPLDMAVLLKDIEAAVCRHGRP